MIQSAFEARTDTLSTWGLLQANCLLLKAEEEQERKARQESTLRRRLREARAARQEAAAQARAKKEKTTDPLIRRLPQAEARRKATDELKEEAGRQSSDVPDYLKPVSGTSPVTSGSEEGAGTDRWSRDDLYGLPDEQSLPQKPAKPCWFTVRGSGRHIVLPSDGELTLGRFDSTFGIPPDIDLAYEDSENHTVSRRHVKIIGVNGYHLVEDTGSRYGVVVNGEKIRPGRRVRLKPGDRVAIGNVQMFYDQIPEYLQDIPQNVTVRHMLIVTATGRKVRIAPPNELVIGRSDRYMDFVPDVDLSKDGEAASRVSRRHAIIQWRNDRPYLEDLGSGFGTRINGKMMLLGQAVPLKPGDHIWLGGCVLAYDMET
jgi:pSer/pThr/pTyr-binding forkhead associated (FHA) protein